MPDDVGDKSEPPTPRRRAEARDSGQVAKSQDLSAAVLLLTALIGFKLFGLTIWQTMGNGMRGALGSDDPPVIDHAIRFGTKFVTDVIISVAPWFAILVVVALVVMYAQVGWLFTFKTLAPKLDKLNPINGAKRIFSSQTLVQLGMNILKLTLVSGVAYLAVRGVFNRLLLAHTVAFAATTALMFDLVFYVGIRLAVVLFVIAILDFIYQRYRHEKQLKMTKEEVKEEMKRMEGDPVVKRRRREVQMRLAMERLKSSVPKADVIVTNPTHYSVAIQYKSDEMVAPKVIAKGVDLMAKRIRELAAESGVPVVQKPELARRLYAEVEVGYEIPERFYRVVAEILAYVYELAGKTDRPVATPVT